MPSRSGAGFDKNPKNINRKGRPKKGMSMCEILRDLVDEETINYKGGVISVKEAVGRKIIELGIQGDLSALKYLFDRLEGSPRQAVEHTGADGGPILIGKEFDKL
jgi:hypothetical protein